MVIYSGTQRIFQISKWKAAAKITCIFGLVLKIKQGQRQRPKERGGRGGNRKEENKREDEKERRRRQQNYSKYYIIYFVHHFPS